MAGYEDTMAKIIATLMGRPAGTEVLPENHQDYALSLLDYVRQLELTTQSTLQGVAEWNTVPVQPEASKVSYILGVAQDQTVVYSNFIDINGDPITVTTGEMEAVFGILMWNTSYWTLETYPTNIISSSEIANFYYGYNVRKTYASVAAMNADITAPVGTDGRLIHIGETVTVANTGTPAENGLYSYEVTSWKLQTTWNFQLSQTTGASTTEGMSQKVVTNITESESIAMLRVHNADLIFQGFVTPTVAPATTTLNHAWIVIESGTISGLTVTRGQIIKRTASAYVAEKMRTPDKFNVTVDIPLGSGFYTASTARAAVPILFKKLGLALIYSTSAGVWIEEQFIGTDISGWATDANWSVGKYHLATESEAIQLLYFYNPNLTFSGFVDSNTPTPSYVANKAYIANGAGTILGLTGVTKGQIIVDSGSTFTAFSFKTLYNYYKKSEIDYTPRPALYVGKNLFNYQNPEIIRDKYLNILGAEGSSTSYTITGYIPVIAGQVIIQTHIGSVNTYIWFYDVDKSLIAASGINTESFTVPANAKYMRCSLACPTATNLETANIQIELGSTKTTFEAYKRLIADSDISNNIARVANYTTTVLADAKFTQTIVSGKNLFDLLDPDVKRGFYINTSYVLTATGSNVSVTGFIPVTVGVTYVCNKNRSTATLVNTWYDSSKVPISSFNAAYATAPAGAAYVRWNISVTAAEDIVVAQVQIEVGSVSTYYEPYYKKLYNSIGNEIKTNPLPESDVSFVMPDVINIAVGRQCNIYKDNHSDRLPDHDYHFKTSFGEFTNDSEFSDMQRNARYTPTSVKYVDTAFIVRSGVRELLIGKTVRFNAISKTAGTGTKNVLFIGDSMTAYNEITGEVKTLFTTDSGGNIALMGHLPSNGGNCEARGGWSLDHYAKANKRRYYINITGYNVSYTLVNTYLIIAGAYYRIDAATLDGSGNGTMELIKDGGSVGDVIASSGTFTDTGHAGTWNYTLTSHDMTANPFWQGGALDFTAYMAKYNAGVSLDIVVIQHAVNGWNSYDASGCAVQIANANTICAAILSAYPSCKIIFSIEPFGGYYDGYSILLGQRYFREMRIAMFLLYKEYIAKAAATPLTYSIAYSNLWIDRLYGYEPVTRVVNSRSAFTVTETTADVHPGLSGEQQIADCIYSQIRAILT